VQDDELLALGIEQSAQVHTIDDHACNSTQVQAIRLLNAYIAIYPLVTALNSDRFRALTAGVRPSAGVSDVWR